MLWYETKKLERGEKIIFPNWYFVKAGYFIRKYEEVNEFIPSNVKIIYPSPEISEPVLIADKPWESDFLGLYSSIVFDPDWNGGTYRLWYEGYSNYDSTGRDYGAILCYAESKDGFTWEKPDLGLVEYNGSKDGNNIIFLPSMHPTGKGIHGSTVFLDPHARSPEEKYKMTYCGYASKDWLKQEMLSTHPDILKRDHSIVCGAISGDGLNWKLLEDPLVYENADSQTIIYWNEEKGKYIGYFRHWEANRRFISYSASETFERWPIPKIIVGLEPFLDPSTDYYTNSYIPWPGASNAHLMMPSMYHRGSSPAPGDHLDVFLGVSHDGINWHWPLQNTPWIPNGVPDPATNGMIFPGAGFVTLPGGEWAFTLGTSPDTHNRMRALSQAGNAIRIGKVRPDGFACIAPVDNEKLAEFWTIWLDFEGRELLVNAESERGGWIEVELVEKMTGKPLPGFSTTNMKRMEGDLRWTRVEWEVDDEYPDGLAEFDDCSVSIHVRMEKSRIYGFKFM
ncbi:MAG: hypothetical protein ACTSUE_06230 [Promethearchaeota archaeon]